jgi:glucoamylase
LVGTAIGLSRLWVTVGYGIINELYYPRVDTPQIRDLGFNVADGKGFWVEVKPNADYASLSIPWGNATGDVGGYHLVWPRDLVETADAILAVGGTENAREILCYLMATQLADGRWAQNQWLSGRPRWTGTQLDEVAFPVLLASHLAEVDELRGIAVQDMIRRALAFLVLNGPASDQDRWEEMGGVNAFTLAAAIAAFVCGAELLDGDAQSDILLLADNWNTRIEERCTAANGP